MFIVVVGASLLGGACGGSGGQMLAAGPGARGVMAEPRETESEVNLQIPEQMLRDPADRLMWRERMRQQILHKTRAMPEDRYVHRVRPDMRRQLMRMGFDDQDADMILADVDRAR